MKSNGYSDSRADAGAPRAWGVVLGFLTAALLAFPAMAAEVTVYKSPSCGCCAKWVEHMRANGFTVEAKNIDNMDMIKKMAGVSDAFQSCHTAMVDGYVVEGHVPADDVKRLLAERPKGRGLAAPGMPSGAPGMEGGPAEKYDVLLFGDKGSSQVFSRY